jgi:hypothetical protein
VQEHQQRLGPLLLEEVDAVTANLLVSPAVAPGRHAGGKVHPYRLFFFFFAL